MLRRKAARRVEVHRVRQKADKVMWNEVHGPACRGR